MYLIYILLIAALIEATLLARGSPIYYRTGIPVFRRRRPDDVQISQLDWSPKLVLIGHNEYAILAPGWEALVFIGVMRGVLRSGDSFEVVGRLNLVRAAFSLFLIVATVVADLWPVAVFVVTIDAIVYAFQAHRFGQVLAHAEVLGAATAG